MVRPVLPSGRVPQTDGRTAGDGAQNRDEEGRARREGFPRAGGAQGRGGHVPAPGAEAPTCARPARDDRAARRPAAGSGPARGGPRAPACLHSAAAPRCAAVLSRHWPARLPPPGSSRRGGPSAPAPRDGGKTRLPRGLGGSPSLPCGSETQRLGGAPRSDSEPEDGREPVEGRPVGRLQPRRAQVECRAGRRSAVRSGREACGHSAPARPSSRALRGQGRARRARTSWAGAGGRTGGGGEGARRGVSLRRMRAGRAGPGLYIELAPAPAERSCRGSGGEEVLSAGGCGREGVLGWREPRERRNGGPESWEPAWGDCVPEVGPCLTGSVSGGPGEARGEGTPSEGPRESLSGHPHLGKISRARGWRCGSLYGGKNS